MRWRREACVWDKQRERGKEGERDGERGGGRERERERERGREKGTVRCVKWERERETEKKRQVSARLMTGRTCLFNCYY